MRIICQFLFKSLIEFISEPSSPALFFGRKLFITCSDLMVCWNFHCIYYTICWVIFKNLDICQIHITFYFVGTKLFTVVLNHVCVLVVSILMSHFSSIILFIWVFLYFFLSLILFSVSRKYLFQLCFMTNFILYFIYLHSEICYFFSLY